ncbi:hypothetical protein VF21_00339 [Pseudogymnoascus sp. 05NY08]|nr:hypothetical protein VF21_00339 [Pseudogymnoascus sp. 05NY08]
MVTATALVLEAANSNFQVERVELKRLQPEEVLVELRATGVCHTDISVQQGKIEAVFPVVLGHEGAGVVREVGANVDNVQVGDHVLLSYSYCNQCRHCQRGKTYQCVKMAERNFAACRPDGSSPMEWRGASLRGCFFGQSSFSSVALVQATSCVKVDKDMPLASLAPLGCGVQTGAGAVYNVLRPVDAGMKSVVIFGIGGVGSAAIMAAKVISEDHAGILTTIIAVDLSEERLELAKQLGATHVINPSTTESVVEAIHRITGPDGLEGAIDCTGVVAVINDMIVALGPGGRAVTIGAPPASAKMSIQVFPFINGCKSYEGSNAGNSNSSEFLPFLVELFRQGRLPIEMLQRTYKPTEVNEAVAAMLEGKVVKPVILWPEEQSQLVGN